MLTHRDAAHTISRSRKRQGLRCAGLLTVAMLLPRWSPAVTLAGGRETEAPKAPAGETPGSSRLKDIPVGPMRLDLGASLRLRAERQDNFDAKGYGHSLRDTFMLERLRLAATLRVRPGVSACLQLQDAHAIGTRLSDRDFPNGSPYNNLVDIRQAFVQWARVGGTPLGIRVGRQSLAFTDNRLMGPGEWGNVGRYAWDALSLAWQTPRLRLDAFYALRVRYHPTQLDHRHFSYGVAGVFATIPLGHAALHASYILRRDDEADNDGGSAPRRHSFALAFDIAHGHIDASAGIVPQLGKSSTRRLRALGAYCVLGYTLPVATRPRIGLHYAYGSGGSRRDDTDGTFDGVFGAVDRYHGRMNLLAWANIHDLQGSFSLSPRRDLRAVLDAHVFRLADATGPWYYANGKPVRHDASGEAGVQLGSEVDLVLAYKASPHVQLQVGYGLFLPGSFVRHTGSHDPAHWGMTQIACGF